MSHLMRTVSDMGNKNPTSIPCVPYRNSHWTLSLLLLLSFPFSVALLSIFFLVLDRLHSLQINSSLSTYSLVDSVGNTRTCKIWFLFQGGGSKGEKGGSLSTYYVPGTLGMRTPLILTVSPWGQLVCLPAFLNSRRNFYLEVTWLAQGHTES